MYLVLAGTYEQFREWCYAHELHPVRDRKFVRYVNNTGDARGHDPVEVAVTGTFWQRRDAGFLADAAERAARAHPATER